MSQQHSVGAIHDSWQQLPDGLRQAIEAVLPAGESPLGWLELDLDTDLNYARGLVVLTARRLLAAAEPAAGRWDIPTRQTSSSANGTWQPLADCVSSNWALPGDWNCSGPDGLLSHWRYTIGLARAAHRLVERFEKVQRSAASGAAAKSVRRRR